MKKYFKHIIIALIVLITAGVIIIPKLISTKENKPPANTQDGRNAPVLADGFIVNTVNAENSIRTIGTIVSNEEVELRSELSKKITGIYFKEGSNVSKGQLLFKLDDSELSAQLNKLLIEEELAVKNLERESALMEKSLTTQQEYDILVNTLDKIRADIELVEIQLSKTDITAPFSGIIGFKKVSIGSYATPSVVLATIQDIGKVKLDFTIPEKYVSEFSKGQKITFTIDGSPDAFEGIVTAYEPKVENNTRSLTVRAVCTNSGRKLLPGTFANVTLNLHELENAIFIPSQALIPKLKGQDVYILKSGFAKLVNVETGKRTEENIQITSGLNSGDTILTTNILRLRPDAKVIIQEIK
ncbi:MAG: Multidrug resistance protein MdtA [Ignavibacteria bacterium]|nr:Multidrug resistance protein MdtA [Ignavibacteria bacterium]